jgi:hypothetical protein
MKAYETPEVQVLGDAASVIQGGGVQKEPDGRTNGPIPED